MADVNIEYASVYDENCKRSIKESVYNRIYAIMSKIATDADVFAGKKDRLDCAHFSFIITYDNKDAGFFYLADEFRYGDAYFLDMSILEEFRGHGIAKQALNKLFEEYNLEDFIIGETKKDNVAANILGEHNGVKIFEDEFNYYLFPESRYQEFVEYNEDHRFEKSISKDPYNNIPISQRIRRK